MFNDKLHIKASLFNYSLPFLLIVLTLLSAANGGVYWWGWPALGLLVCITCLKRLDTIQLTPLLLAVFAYLLMMLFNIVYINPVFHIEGLYFISFLALSFLLGRGLDENRIGSFYRATLFCFCLLSLWALFQYLTGMGFIEQQANRANTVYSTPNSFAAALNLVLLPLIIYRLTLPRSRRLDYVILLLFAALLVSQSRGGWIAFTAGLSIGTLLLGLTRQIRFSRQNLLLFIKALLLLAILVVYHQSDTNKSLITRTAVDSATTAEKAVRFSSISHRLHFYQIAWNQFLEKPLLGNGYFNYKYFLNRDNTPELAKKGTTHFVHNDYLQHLLETGLLGFLTLMAVILTFYFQAWRHVRQSHGKEKVYVLAIVASLTAFFVHALGDFVFYLPAIVLFFGLTLGYFDRLSQQVNQLKHIDFTSLFNNRLRQTLQASMTLVLIGFVLLPVVARNYAVAAEQAYEQDKFTQAMTDIKRAQTLAPYESGYIYQEVRLWLEAVRVQQSAEAANTADRLLVEAIATNPFEKYLLLERARLHRDYSHLLNEPAELNVILEWQEEVLAWQSKIRNNAAQIEYIKTLKKAGRMKEASELYAQFQRELLESRGFNRLMRQVFNPEG